MQRLDIAMVGLGEIGQSLTLSMVEHGYAVGVYEMDTRIKSEFMMTHGGLPVTVFNAMEDLIKSLTSPRKVFLMVEDNQVDAVLKMMTPHLLHGDSIMVGRYTDFEDTIQRASLFEKRGIHYMDIGMLYKGHHAAFMVGGEDAAYRSCSRILKDIALRVDDKPCCGYVGRSGAGHFMKMMHDSILEVDMQIIAEGYHLMRELGRFGLEEVAMVLRYANEGLLESDLVAVTADLLEKRDRVTGLPIAEIITEGEDATLCDKIGKLALTLEVAMPTMLEVLSTRQLAAKKSERLVAANILSGTEHAYNGDRYQLADTIIKAMYASRIVNYTQAFCLIKAASMKYKWYFNMGNMAKLWRRGFAVSGQIFDHVQEAYERNPHLLSLMLDEYFRDALIDAQKNWRQTISLAVENGVPVPTMAASLFYYDTYRTAALPDGLIRAQRLILRDKEGRHRGN